MKPVIYVIAKPYDAAVIRYAAVEAGYDVIVSDGSDHPVRKAAEANALAVVVSMRLAPAIAAEVLEQLRSCSGEKRARVMLIAEPDAAITARQASDLGADHVMTRPIDPILLIAKIDAWLARRQEQERGGKMSSEVDLTRSRIEACYARVKEGDYFSLLELSPDATLEEIQQAYLRARHDLDPRQLPEQLVAELSDKIDETLQVVDEAFRVLGNDTLRQAYREHLP